MIAGIRKSFISASNRIQTLLRRIRIRSLNTSLFVLLTHFFRSLYDGWITMRAAAISFNFFMALPPILLFIFSVLPYFNLVNLHEEIVSLINRFMPVPMQSQLILTINEIMNVPNTGFISLSIILTLFFASNGFLGILNAFGLSIQIRDIRSWWKQQLIAVMLFIITIVIMVMVILFMNIREFLVSLWGDQTIYDKPLLSLLFRSVSVLFVMIFVYIEVRILFYFGTVGKKSLATYSLPSILTTVIIGITSIIFNYYITHFSRYNILYGSIGTIMILLLWLYINAIILIAGFELHTSFLNAKNRVQYSNMRKPINKQ